MSRPLVLVNPNFQPNVQRIAQTSVGPPLGLAYLAAAVRQAGHAVAIVDANALALSTAETVRAVLEHRPDVVGLTATTPTIRKAGAVAAALKAERPDLVVLVGGPHATALPERTLQEQPAIDVVARGEGERTLPRILERLASGAGVGSLGDIPGLAFRGPDGVVDTGVATPLADLDSLPEPARDLLPMARYRCPDSNSFSTLLAMRGCPYPCVYCAVPDMFGRRMRFRSAEAVVDEMEGVHRRYGTTFFSFLDDTFTTRHDWVRTFADLMIRRGLARKVRWICLTRADLVDRPLLQRMREAGCVRVEFGIETGSDTGRGFLKKGLGEEAVVEAFRAARAVGLSTMGFAILNIPGETPADVQRTLDLVLRADPDYLQVSFLTPYPGTPLFARAEAEGWISTYDWSRYSFLNDVVLRHDGRPGTGQEAYAAFLRRFYLRPRTVWKLARLVANGTTHVGPLARTVGAGLLALVLPRRADEAPPSDGGAS